MKYYYLLQMSAMLLGAWLYLADENRQELNQRKVAGIGLIGGTGVVILVEAFCY